MNFASLVVSLLGLEGNVGSLRIDCRFLFRNMNSNCSWGHDR